MHNNHKVNTFWTYIPIIENKKNLNIQSYNSIFASAYKNQTKDIKPN